jgi:hypothetical protein
VYFAVRRGTSLARRDFLPSSSGLSINHFNRDADSPELTERGEANLVVTFDPFACIFNFSRASILKYSNNDSALLSLSRLFLSG